VSSTQLFETLTAEEYKEQGGGGAAGRGTYAGLLIAFAQTGERFARITTADGGIMPGKKASSIATALKNAKKSDNAPSIVKQISVTSRGAKEGDGPNSLGVVFLENEAVEEEAE
jgi:hypothetical protein